MANPSPAVRMKVRTKVSSDLIDIVSSGHSLANTQEPLFYHLAAVARPFQGLEQRLSVVPVGFHRIAKASYGIGKRSAETGPRSVASAMILKRVKGAFSLRAAQQRRGDPRRKGRRLK